MSNPQNQQEQQAQHQQHKKLEDKKQLQQLYEKQNPYQFTSDMYEICPDLKLFDKLLEYENYIDKMIKRKRFDLQEQFARPLPKLKHVLRITIQSYFINLENQMDAADPPHFVIKVSGQLMADSSQNFQILSNRKFTSFFNKIEFELDEKVYSHHRDLLWKRTNQVDTDGIELKRIGNYESNVLVKLFLNNNPPKYKIKEQLADVIGYQSCTRSVALSAIWDYIKFKNLQDRENKNEINNDEVFKEIFKCEKMSIGSITARLRDLVEEDEPIEIYHQIKKNQKEVAQYDQIVEVDYPYTLEIMPFLSQKVLIDEKKESASHPFIVLNQKIKRCERKSIECLERLKSLKFKRDAYLAYDTNPSMYLENVLIQQNLLLKIMSKNDDRQQDDPQKIQYFNDHEDVIIKEIQKMLSEPRPFQQSSISQGANQAQQQQSNSLNNTQSLLIQQSSSSQLQPSQINIKESQTSQQTPSFPSQQLPLGYQYSFKRENN